MRLTMLLAIIATMMAASPALAQSPYGGYTKVRPASMKTRKAATRTVAATHVEATVASRGHYHVSSGCDACAPSCNTCCKPPLLPSLIDNLPDLFACLRPCPTPYKSCAAGPHCCPYPKRPVINHHCRPNLLGAIFGSRGCCKSCTSCTSCSTGCATSGCSSCTAGAVDEMAPELIHPPTPTAEMEDPFRDDPIPTQRGAVRKSPTTKTTSRQQPWYKTVRHAPVVAAEEAYEPSIDEVYEPSVLVVGGAQPLVVSD